MKYIKDYDLEVYNAILEEEKRQEEGIELIASENFVSKAVPCLQINMRKDILKEDIMGDV